MESVVIATEMSLEGFSPQILEHLFISKNIKTFSDTLSQSINDFDILNRRTKKLRLILKKNMTGMRSLLNTSNQAEMVFDDE